MKQKHIIKIGSGQMRQKHLQIANTTNVSIDHGEQIAIVGANGAGKSTLVGILTGAHPLIGGEGVRYSFGEDDSNNKAYENIKYIAFHDASSASGGYFYQQRWNSTMIEDSPKVCDEIKGLSTDEAFQKKLFSLFGIDEIYHRRVISLSSGELRKFQMVKVLLSAPRILIADNPFIGLDAATRTMLHALLQQLSTENLVQIILVLSKTDDIPRFITHVIALEQQICKNKCTLDEFEKNLQSTSLKTLSEEHKQQILQLPNNIASPNCDMVAEFRKVSIRYGERTILEELNWDIKLGEKWILSGENGSGKSTLLSLLCADNPQSYACNISLWGKRRGSGESIWDIKRHIGYVSPEMHRAYLLPNTAMQIVASGLYDTIGVRSKINEVQTQNCLMWMRIFGIETLAERNFMQLSSGEQRLVLVCRAFVKDPALLVLDEPLHGLDMQNRLLVSQIISTFAQRKNKSIIYVTHYANEVPACFTKSLSLKKTIN